MIKGTIDPVGSEHGEGGSRGTSFSQNEIQPRKTKAATEQVVRIKTIRTLAIMAGEATVMRAAAGGSVTDTVAGWLAPHYAQAMHEQLSKLKGKARLELLRTFVEDWALLRHGDQTAERLQIERERLDIAERSRLDRFKHKLTFAMEAFKDYVQEHPQAQAAFNAMAEQIRDRHPFDPREQAAP